MGSIEIRSERQNETQKIEFSLEIYIYLEKHQKNKKLTTEFYVAFFFHNFKIKTKSQFFINNTIFHRQVI